LRRVGNVVLRAAWLICAKWSVRRFGTRLTASFKIFCPAVGMYVCRSRSRSILPPSNSRVDGNRPSLPLERGCYHA
jgi:hypothetical protein